MTNDDRWKRHRRWFQQGFHTKTRLDGYVPVQQREVRQLLVDLLRDPQEVLSHFKRCAFSRSVVLQLGHISCIGLPRR